MTKEFEPVVRELTRQITIWENIFIGLPEDLIRQRRNSQGRNIKQITGHMIDSASNNTHRAIHLQYRKSPLEFPNYASEGNNDKWIAIQNYEEEDWSNMIQLWKYAHLHLVHVIKNINPLKLENEWFSGPVYGNIPLRKMIMEFLPHFILHTVEIDSLINKES